MLFIAPSNLELRLKRDKIRPNLNLMSLIKRLVFLSLCETQLSHIEASFKVYESYCKIWCGYMST